MADDDGLQRDGAAMHRRLRRRAAACNPGGGGVPGAVDRHLRPQGSDVAADPGLPDGPGLRLPAGAVRAALRASVGGAVERGLRVLGRRPRQRGRLALGERGGPAVRHRRVQRASGRARARDRGGGRVEPRRRDPRDLGRGRRRDRPAEPRGVQPRSAGGGWLGGRDVQHGHGDGADAARLQGHERFPHRRVPVQPSRQRQRLLERRLAAAPRLGPQQRRRPGVRGPGLATDHRDHQRSFDQLRDRAPRIPRGHRDARRHPRPGADDRAGRRRAGRSPRASRRGPRGRSRSRRSRSSTSRRATSTRTSRGRS